MKKVSVFVAFIGLALGLGLITCTKKLTPPEVKTGTLIVRSTPTSAKIWLNGNFTYYYTPNTLTLEAGTYQLKLTKNWYFDWQEQVEVRRQDTTTVEAILEEQPYGSLSVNSVPPNATINLDGQTTSYRTPHTFQETAAGTHYLELTLTGYEVWQDSVIVVDDQLTVVQAVLDPLPTGFIIQSQPSGASIILNGEDTGLITPDTLDELVAGTYLLRLQYPSYFPWQITDSLTLGEIKAHFANLDPAPVYIITYTADDTIYQVGCDGISPEILATNFKDWSWGSGPGNILWSPNSQYLVYTSNSVNLPVAIIDHQGTPIVNLIGRRSSDFCWSSDSRYVVYGYFHFLSHDVNGIYRYDTQTGDFTRLLPGPSDIYYHDPVYSPNGSFIAYIVHMWGYHAYLYMIAADGSNQHVISNRFTTGGHDEDVNLSWTSDTALVCKTTTGLYLFDLSGYNDSTLIDPVLIIPDNISRLKLSRDRQWFAYRSATNNLYYGQTDTWAPHYLVHFIFSLYHFDWAPNNSALACRTYDSVHWVTPDGTDYSIIQLRTRSRGAVGITP